MFKTVHILAIETGNEPHALRAVLECWGLDVSITWVGNADQVVAYLSSKPSHDLIIISGHGDANTLYLPELAAELAAEYRYKDQLTTNDFREFLDLKQNVVLNLSCEGGGSALAQVFLEQGASTYIGAKDAPDGSAALMYALEWLYAVNIEGKSLNEAHALATNHLDDRSIFVVWQ